MTDEFEELIRSAGRGLAGAQEQPTYHAAWVRGRRRRAVKRGAIAVAGALVLVVALGTNVGRLPSGDSFEEEVAIAPAESPTGPAPIFEPTTAPVPLDVSEGDQAQGATPGAGAALPSVDGEGGDGDRAIAATPEPTTPAPAESEPTAAATDDQGAVPSGGTDPTVEAEQPTPDAAANAAEGGSDDDENSTAASDSDPTEDAPSAQVDATPPASEPTPASIPTPDPANEDPGDSVELTVTPEPTPPVVAVEATPVPTVTVVPTPSPEPAGPVLGGPADARVLAGVLGDGDVLCATRASDGADAKCELLPPYACIGVDAVRPNYVAIDTDGDGQADRCVASVDTTCDTNGDTLGDVACLIRSDAATVDGTTPGP
ncbi:MAG: hypothetical protein AAF567_20940 [Actinomycetota bacterium]